MFELAAVLAQQNEVAINLTLPGIIALIAGVLILIFPAILNYVVAAYLIVFGLIQVFDINL